MAAITISQALSWRKTLEARHNELVSLRNQNANEETRFYGANVDKERVIRPLYDVVALDKLISNLAKEVRNLDEAVKATNAAVNVTGYDRNDDILGEVTAAPAPVASKV